MNLRNKKLNLTLDLDKVLLGLAFIYLGCVLIWLFRQDRLKLPFANKPSQPPVTETKKTATVNPEFIDYLRRSLNRLEREQTAAVPSAPPPIKVPTAGISSPPTPIPQSPPTVVERIYVPVYPSNQSPPVESYPSSVRVPPAKTPVPPPLSVAPSSVTSLTPGPKAIPSPLGYTLVGLLESGEVGYALFKVNGMDRRFERGELIGNSGWTLAAVRNQTAIISRNEIGRAHV